MEEILQRIKSQPGVERCVISTAEGQVLRQFPNMPQEKAGAFAMSTKDLTNKARGVVRDLNPKEVRERKLWEIVMRESPTVTDFQNMPPFFYLLTGTAVPENSCEAP